MMTIKAAKGNKSEVKTYIHEARKGQSITPWLRVTQGPLTHAKLIFAMEPTVTS